MGNPPGVENENYKRQTGSSSVCRTRAVKLNRRADCMQLSKLSRRVKVSHEWDGEEKLKSKMMVTCGAFFAYGSLHCNGWSAVRGFQDWHIFTFQNVSSGKEPKRSRARSCPKSETLNQWTRQRGAATRYTQCHSPSPQKRPCRNTNLAPCCKSLVLWKNSGNNPLRALLNIPWRSSSLGSSIFYHKASRRTSASERILAELGTFQGPGLRDRKSVV